MFGSLFEWLFYALSWQAQIAIAGVIALAVALTLLLFGSQGFRHDAGTSPVGAGSSCL